MAGLVLGALLARHPPTAHRVYAANLAGSAAGGLGAVPLVARAGPEVLVPASAALGLAAACALAWGGGRSPRSLLGWAAAAALALAALGGVAPAAVPVQVSPYKALAQALRADGARHALSRWSNHGRVDVVESESIHVFPGLSQTVTWARPPRQAGLTMDGDNLVPITALHVGEAGARALALAVPEAVAHALRPRGRWLVLDPGGGWPVLLALAGGARHVTAVEPNRQVARVMQSDYAAWTGGLYAQPRLELVLSDPRAHLNRSPGAFDVVLPALHESFHPVTSGAYSLGEDYRLTVEGIDGALRQASPDGVVVVTRWLQTPPTESVRVMATVLEALRRRGADRPADHVAAFRSMRTMTFVVSPRVLTPAERSALRDFTARLGYDLTWLADLRAGETNRHLRLPRPAYHEALSGLVADPAEFVRAHPFDVRPTTDDRPFFQHYFRWRQTPQVLAGLGRTWQPFGGSGYFVLVVLLLAASGLASALVLGPLLVASGQRRSLGRALGDRRSAAAYFGALGAGYMFVLIPLTQRAILVLGGSAQAFAVVSAALLFFSGLGSLSAPRRRAGRTLLVLAALVAAAPIAVAWAWNVALAWPLPARLAVVCLTLAPLGLPMGVPFPAGLRRLEQRDPGSTAWAWAVNGSASVVAGVMAAMIALAWGFSVVLWCGAAAYGVARAAWPRLERAGDASAPRA